MFAGAVACTALLPALRLAHAGSPPGSGKRRRYPLQPGQYYWIPQIAPTGPVVAVVNLHTQMAQVFRNGVVIGFSSTSTGKPGYGTPSGLFSILEKRRFHRSSTYNNAPMPWMVRLTWSGVAFHAGNLPGYPASHGCIRLPNSFAPRFFGSVTHGDTVWITRNALPSQISPMTTLAPITPDGLPMLQPGVLEQPQYWRPSADTANALPLNLLVSLSQQRLYVLHQGQLLASSKLPDIPQHIQFDGGALFEWQPSKQWQARDATASQWGESLVRHALPPDAAFTQRLKQLLGDGSRLFISHLPAINDLHWAVPS